ncbi:hypothetical protein RFI_22548 [Reticulomyxa filosa]|uniref:Uncharacterized protein n=1 Tax=Reticulomyxa filosa TaxID=46433 RepID=X6MP13_RETFI|nr:hypothetical protein RFI_22548 [Reticulomyxa filosa]|eukprot:ETO14820.1 hypothetical protein RFI_22548 [Reticulomyxa filosa]
MVEEILQVHNNSKKIIYLSCVIIFVRKQWRNTLDEIKKTIEDAKREREEEAEVNKNKDDKVGHGHAKSTVANFFGVVVGDRVQILENKTCVMSYLVWSFPMKRIYGKWYDLFIRFEKKKSLISVEFCFNVRKQTDGGNDDED